MALKKNRNMKVYSKSGYNYQAVPTIMLKGKWLSEAGFQIGDYISVYCENGKLVITPDRERAAIEAAEVEFIEKEIKNLRKKFEQEKLHFQFVAEQKSGYGN